MISKEAKVLIGIAIVVIGGGVALFLATPKPQEAGKIVDQKQLIRETNHMTGKTGAKATLVEFGDYQCPYCGVVEPALEAMVDHYKDNADFNFVFKNFPLTGHPNAVPAAEAAEAAGSQGKFWEMHNLIYSRQSQWENEVDTSTIFINYAREVGVADINKFTSDIQNHLQNDLVTTDLADGNSIGVRATPTFYLNGEKLDFKTLPKSDEFIAKIDAALK